MKFDIQLFGKAFAGEDNELGFSPSAFNSMTNQYDGIVPGINQSLEVGQEAMKVFKAVAGSPRLSQDTQGIINCYNETIVDGKNYMDSVRNWSGSVIDLAATFLSFFGLSPISQSLTETLMDYIETSYNGDNIGIKNFSSSTDYIAQMNNLASTFRNGTDNLADAVSSAYNSLPSIVKSNLSATISNSNEKLATNVDKIKTWLEDNIERFTTELQSAIDDLAAGAAGTSK